WMSEPGSHATLSASDALKPARSSRAARQRTIRALFPSRAYDCGAPINLLATRSPGFLPKCEAQPGTARGLRRGTRRCRFNAPSRLIGIDELLWTRTEQSRRAGKRRGLARGVDRRQ